MKEIPSQGCGERGLWYFNKETGKLQRQQVTKREQKAPSVITDEIDPIVSHVDDEGRVFTSKRKYEQHLKEKGFAIKEQGMCTRELPNPADLISKEKIREMTEKAYYDCKFGRIPFSEQEKATHLREEREWEKYKRRRR